MESGLSLEAGTFELPDVVISNDALSLEALGEVEDLYAATEDNDDPVLQHVKVHDLHIWTELDGPDQLLRSVVPKTQLGGGILDVGAGPNEEEDVRVFVRVAQRDAS